MQDSLTGKIIAAAFKVYNKLGFGFIEKVYENARLLELRKQGLSAGQQVPLSVYYDEKIVGEFYLDLFVEEQVIVELKSVAHLHAEHEVQLAHYLTATRQDIGLLINFGPKSVEVKRKYRVYQPRKA